MWPELHKMASVFLLVTVLLVESSLATKFRTDCELARELRRHKFHASELPNWVCLAKAESGGDSRVKGKRNSNGSYDYGLFQINSKYWCGIHKAGGDCNIKCSDLLDDDISNDSRCAKKIKGRHGFRGWYGWRSKCEGKTLPDVSKC